jgi:DNA polymerase (family 10)
MKKGMIRRIFKKGKIHVTRRGEFVSSLAGKVVSWIRPYSKRIEIVGSIRRKEKNPVDIDIVVIPKDRQKIEEVLEKHGRKKLGGEKKIYFRIDDVEVEIYYTTPDEWGAALLAYSSRFGAGIGLRVVARAKGFKLSQHGLFSRKTGRRVAGRTEQEIYHALGRPWKPPEKR